MFQRFRRKPKKEPEDLNAPLQGRELGTSLEENTGLLRRLFQDVDTMIFRPFCNPGDGRLRFCLLYSDGVVDNLLINEHIVEPLMLAKHLHPGKRLLEEIQSGFVASGDAKAEGSLRKIIEAVTYGDTLLLVEGCAQGLLINSKSFVLRGVTEPEGEKVLSGPREGFTESIMINLSMVRRRLRTNQLKMRFSTLGRETGTGICVCYLEGIVNKGVLTRLEQQLKEIDIDGVLDVNYITEFISPPSAMGFGTAGYTERPDIVAAKLLEGRVAVFVDGSPTVMTAPFLFIENFQSNEDYYVGSYYASFARLLRVLGFFCTISVAALYIAISCYHHELMPPSLLISIASERDSVPLPAAIEAFIMLIVFDILRETGVRMPSHVGQALSIVGALVIGQAAVEAKLVAAPMIIVVAFTGITNLLVPKLNAASMACRFLLLFMASVLGFVGLVCGLSICVVHVLNLESFGVPQMIPPVRLQYQEIKDTVIRAPWPRMLTRPTRLSRNRRRIKEEGGHA